MTDAQELDRECRRPYEAAYMPSCHTEKSRSKSACFRQCTDFLYGFFKNTALQEGKKTKRKSLESLGISRLFIKKAADRI